MPDKEALRRYVEAKAMGQDVDEMTIGASSLEVECA